jgi:hypothetical protein
VLALVFALIPLAMHGGPLWEPMCYAQIGGMMVATFITLLLVPVIYSIFVLDLKLIKWEATGEAKEIVPKQQYRQLSMQRQAREMKIRRYNIQGMPFMALTMCAGLALAMSTGVEPVQAQQRQDATTPASDD